MEWLLFFDLSELAYLTPLGQQWWVFMHGGWVIVLLIGLPLWWVERLRRKRISYLAGIKYVLLAIDVPKETEQSPKAVESIFTALAGSFMKPNKYKRYILGEIEKPFSFEIVSLGGYIQFFIRTPEDFRDLVEAAVYAQYPDAEIVESEDYVDRVSSNFDTDEYDLWGTEFILENKDIYPIRTYVDFEHQASEDFKDPMAATLEILSRIKPDEDVWLQLLVTPIDDSWQAMGIAEVKKLTEGQKTKKAGVFQNFGSGLSETLRVMGDSLVSYSKEENEKKQEMVVPTIIRLTPGQRNIVEAIERKISKIGFKTKFRMIYWGRRETFLKGRGVNAVVGAIKQYTALNLNGFKPSSLVTTKADYFLVHQRITKKQKKILRAYKLRSPFRGAGHGRILNTEELATLYHFPVMTVKAPLIKKTDMKKAEPPFALPVFRNGARQPIETGSNKEPIAGQAPPANLPFIE
ncbi:MAG: hypothetical protein V1712_00885 [Patescibacteria group bacterium]